MRRAYLVGHSLGARACLDVALRTLEAVAGVVAVTPIGFGHVSRTGSLLLSLIYVITEAEPQPSALPDPGRATGRPDIDSLSGVKVPTLLVWGTRDRYLPVAQANRAAEMLPHAELRVLPNRGHTLTRRHRSKESPSGY